MYRNVIKTILGYIDKNIKEDINMERLAETASYSTTQFFRIFLSYMKIPPMNYVQRRKIYFAAKELIYSEEKIIDIAFSYGFKSHDVFTRVFKRYYGVSPSEFRILRRNLKKIFRNNYYYVSDIFVLSLNNLKEKKIMTHQISLETMIPYHNETSGLSGEGTGIQKLINSDGELVINADGDIDCLQTTDSYTLPLRIDLTAKTDSTNIRLYYKSGEVIFNWECCPEELRVHDILMGTGYGYCDQGSIPKDEYVDISWVIEKRHMDIYVNGELRHHRDDYPYIGLLMIEANRVISEPVRISAAWGSTVTVKSLTITDFDKTYPLR